MDAREKAVIRLTSTGHSFFHLIEGVVPPLIPLLMVEFDTSYFRIGLVVTVFSYAFGLGSLPAGIAADRFGPRRLTTLFLLSTGALLVTVIGVTRYSPYLVIMGIVGLLSSIYHPAGTTLISHEVKETGRAFGIHGIAGSIGIAAAPAITALLASRFGWRAPHAVFGILGILAGLYALTLPRRAKTAAPKGSDATHTFDDRNAPWPVLLVCFASFAVLGMAYRGLMTFLPVYMAEYLTVPWGAFDSVTVGGTVATITLAAGAVGQYIGGRSTDRVRPELVYTLGTLAAGTFVIAMTFASGVLLFVLAVLHALFAFSIQPVQNYVVSRYLSSRRLGLAFGFKYLMIFGVGAIAGALGGLIADHVGLPAVFLAVGGCFFVGSAMGLYLDRRAPRRPPQAPNGRSAA